MYKDIHNRVSNNILDWPLLTLNPHLDGHLINILIDTQSILDTQSSSLTLDGNLINSQSIVRQVSTNSYVSIDGMSAKISRLSLKMLLMECQSRVLIEGN